MPPFTLVPNVLKATVTPTPGDEKHVELACEIFKNDKTLDPQLRDTIVNTILVDKGLSDAGRTAGVILNFYDESDTAEYIYDTYDDQHPAQGTAAAKRSVMSFPEVFVAGMTFLRTYDDEYSMNIRSGKAWLNQRMANIGDRCPFRLGPFCEVTGDHGPAANLTTAYILPYEFGKSRFDPRQEKFWDLLRFLWAPETVDEIKVACARPDIDSQTRAFSNGILMSSVCRKSFDAFEFYLLPILDDYSPLKYRVTFIWVHKPHMNEQMQHNFRLSPFINDYNKIEHHILSTGDTITLETTDPAKYPLPDPGLLLVRALLAKFSLPIESVAFDNMIFDYDYDHFAEDDKQSDHKQSENGRQDENVESWLAEAPDERLGEPVLVTEE